MSTIKKISALLLTSILAFSAVSCGDEGGSKSSSDNSKPYEKPINTLMTSFQKKDPDKFIEATTLKPIGVQYWGYYEIEYTDCQKKSDSTDDAVFFQSDWSGLK